MNKTTTAAPVFEAKPTIPQPFTTVKPTTTTTTTTLSTTTVKVIPYSYEEVSLPPPTAAKAAIIKVLEEAIKIEHQRRERKRIEARQQQEQGRTRRHSPNEGSFRIEIPRCVCGLHPRRGIFSMFPSRGVLKTWGRHRPCRCMPREHHRHLVQRVQDKFASIQHNITIGECPDLLHDLEERKKQVWIMPFPSCTCVESSSNATDTSCHCLHPQEERDLERRFGRESELLREGLILQKCTEEIVRRRRLSEEDIEESTELAEDSKQDQLPRSGRSKGGFGFNFGRRTGGWGNGNWRILGRQNNANTGGLWGPALPALGTSLF